MNNDSFTDEQLLNLVNNTIVEKTDFSPSDFTGGAIQVTATHKNKIISMKVVLMFGYDNNKNSRSIQVEIDESTYYVWSKAILLKTHSLRADTTGADLNELNRLMNTVSEKRKKEETPKVDTSKIFSFTLSRKTSVNNLSKQYLEKLKEHIENSTYTLTYEEFINGLESKGNKYVNFRSAYNTWAKNKAKWDADSKGKNGGTESAIDRVFDTKPQDNEIIDAEVE